MAFKKSFHLIGQGTPNVRYFFPVQKAKLASMLCDSSEDNLIYTRHMYYTDMAEMGCNVSYFNMYLTSTWSVSGRFPTLIMLNTFQMRDPVDRFVSRYNYYREVWEATKDPISKPSKFATGYDLSCPIPLQRPGLPISMTVSWKIILNVFIVENYQNGSDFSG